MRHSLRPLLATLLAVALPATVFSGSGTGTAILTKGSAKSPKNATARVPARDNRAQVLRGDALWVQALSEVRRASSKSADQLDRSHSKRTRLLQLRQGDRSRREVALTFDDGPHPEWTKSLLSVLRSLDVKATFFVVGHMAAQYPQLVRAEVAEGHLVANHSFSHATLTNLSAEEVKTEYLACSQVLKTITGATPKFCRPPGGDCHRMTLQAASEIGLTTVFWTDDPGDYMNRSTRYIVRRVVRNLRNGSIILLHDGTRQALEGLPLIVAAARKLGYRFVTLSELARRRT